MIYSLGKYFEQLRSALLGQIGWVVASGEMLQLKEGVARAFPENKRPWCVVVMPGAFVTSTRRYKAISRKELLAIVNNEREFLSPFINSLSPYNVAETDDGGWSVDFYFIDLERYPELKEIFAIIPGDTIIHNMHNPDSPVMRYRGALGEFLIDIHQGRFKVHTSSERRLKSIYAEEDFKQRVEDYTVTDCIDGLVQTMLRSSFWSQRAAIQWALLPAWLKRIFIRPALWRNFGVGLAVWITLQSLYLVATEWLITRDASAGAEIRADYAAGKKEYLLKLNLLASMRSLTEHHGRLAFLGDLFAALSGSGKVELTRFDYRDGEYQIVGVTDNIDAMISTLTQYEGVDGVEFNSPVRPTREGLDKFNLRFEIANE